MNLIKIINLTKPHLLGSFIFQFHVIWTALVYF